MKILLDTYRCHQKLNCTSAGSVTADSKEFFNCHDEMNLGKYDNH
ncbi:Uncharacterized protein dnl_33570 [Desulfonema limicola]|uniref:Uncharacterized protein n=1 Tax=Desulfonema limicola TaxID=45656 RepID=A0A975B8P7_9BACT|nr:Uncharacterized protein dnl_33570 [Desulfonema limicola]